MSHRGKRSRKFSSTHLMRRLIREQGWTEVQVLGFLLDFFHETSCGTESENDALLLAYLRTRAGML